MDALFFYFHISNTLIYFYLVDGILYHLYNFFIRNKRDYSKRLFVCGCPRSGTTALWRLLTRHPQIGMGVERYINKVDGSFIELTADLFKKERFFSLRAGDTHFPDLTSGGAGRYYTDLAPRFEECEWLGDKMPVLYKNYQGLFYRFPNAHVIFILRDIYDVANSFMARLKDKEDNWGHDYKDAVKKWNKSLEKTYQFKKKGAKIFCIDYDELYYSNYEIDKIFQPLGLECFKQLETFYKNEKIFAQRLVNKRIDYLGDEEKKYIEKHSNIELFEYLKSMKDSFK